MHTHNSKESFFGALITAALVLISIVSTQPSNRVRADALNAGGTPDALPVQASGRPLARDAGVVVGVIPTGPLLFRATTTTGRGHTVEALPIDRTLGILRRHGALTETSPKK